MRGNRVRERILNGSILGRLVSGSSSANSNRCQLLHGAVLSVVKDPDTDLTTFGVRGEYTR